MSRLKMSFLFVATFTVVFANTIEPAVSADNVLPDLVCQVRPAGHPRIVGSKILVPLRVIVRNRNAASTVKFKVALRYVSPAVSRPRVGQFAVRGQTDRRFPWLKMGPLERRLVDGYLVVPQADHNTLNIRAYVDSHLLERSVPRTGRVREQVETNNASNVLYVQVP